MRRVSCSIAAVSSSIAAVCQGICFPVFASGPPRPRERSISDEGRTEEPTSAKKGKAAQKADQFPGGCRTSSGSSITDARISIAAPRLRAPDRRAVASRLLAFAPCAGAPPARCPGTPWRLRQPSGRPQLAAMRPKTRSRPASRPFSPLLSTLRSSRTTRLPVASFFPGAFQKNGT